MEKKSERCDVGDTHGAGVEAIMAIGSDGRPAN
jgi:hypothetical protein